MKVLFRITHVAFKFFVQLRQITFLNSASIIRSYLKASLNYAIIDLGDIEFENFDSDSETETELESPGVDKFLLAT